MIITLGRQHGSNGHDIAKALAQELGYKCYDKELIDHTADTSGFSREILNSFDEKKVSNYVVATPHYIGMSEGFRLNMEITNAQFEAIRELANKGDCIFVGRCADYILREREDVIRVFIMADKEFRTKTMMAKKNLTEDQAKKLIKQVDKDRSSYYRYYTDQVWGDAENYDICINSGRIGVDGAVKAIKAFVAALEK